MPELDRTVRDLLRENLATVPIDVFYIDDPMQKLPPEEKKLYLKYFADIQKDGRLPERLKFLINKQALLTLQSSHTNSSVFDIAGSMTMNGIAAVKDDIQKLAIMHVKEEGAPASEFNKMGI